MDEPKGHYAKTRQMLHDLSYIDYTSFSEAEVIVTMEGKVVMRDQG